MAEAHADKWKAMKKKSFLQIPPDTDCPHQHFIHVNYSTYLINAPPIAKEASFTNWSWTGASGWLLSPC